MAESNRIWPNLQIAKKEAALFALTPPFITPPFARSQKALAHLLEARADVDKADSWSGSTPVYAAAYHGNEQASHRSKGGRNKGGRK